MTALVLRADTRTLPLPDASVDLIVTSPPYFALRSYTDGGQHYAGQIGSEDTPAEWVAALLDCTREWMRVLKPTGSIFVNLGDKYNSAASGQNGTGATTLDPNRGPKLYGGERGSTVAGARPKSLLGLPWRYALRCIDELGLILRAEVIWSKPNGLPESVTDRVRRSHEQWFHFTVQPRYYAAVDEIREPHTGGARPGGPARRSAAWQDSNGGDSHRFVGSHPEDYNPLGKLPGSVWSIPSEPLTVPDHLGVDHFAAFPTEWPRRIILGWSPPGVCIACGEGRRPVVDKPGLTGRDNNTERRGANGSYFASGMNGGQTAWERRMAQPDRITGYACACPEPTAPTRPAVVLDPFGGTGTTALVASVLGRVGVSVDLSADYCRLARWRKTDEGQRAKVARKLGPPPACCTDHGSDCHPPSVCCCDCESAAAAVAR